MWEYELGEGNTARIKHKQTQRYLQVAEQVSEVPLADQGPARAWKLTLVEKKGTLFEFREGDK